MNLRKLSKRPEFLWGAALALYAGVLLFSLLDFVLVYQVSEGREGVVVNEILSSGEWVLPLRNGHIVPSKPILFHWLGAGVAKIRGVYDETGLRFPSALAGLATVLVVYWLTMRFSSPATGFLSGMMLLSMYGFFHMTQDGRVDMLFTALMVSAIAVWLVAAHDALRAGKGMQGISSRVYLAVSVLMGLAVLAKGPLGIVLPALVIGSVSLLLMGKGGWKVALKPAWILAVAIPLPWYVFAAMKGEERFIGRQIVFENISRFLGGEGIPIKPFWFYIPEFFEQAFPWSMVFAIYVFFLGKGEREKRKGRIDRNPFLPTTVSASFGVRSGLLWIGTTLLFLSLSAGKRRAYLLPLFPALSFLLALRFAATWERWRQNYSKSVPSRLLSRRIFQIGLTLWVIVVGGALSVYLSRLDRFPWLDSHPEFRVSLQSIPSVLARSEGRLEIFFFVFSGFTIAAWVYAFRKREPLFAGLAALLFFHFILIVHVNFFSGIQGATHTYKPFALRLRENIPDDVPVRFMKTIKDESFDGFFFYYRKHVVMLDPKTTPQDTGLYIARRSWLDAKRSELSGTVIELDTGGRTIDEPEKDLVLFRVK